MRLGSRLLLVVALVGSLVLACACRPAPGPSPASGPAGSEAAAAAAAASPAPHELAPLVAEEERLLTCLRVRSERVVAALETGAEMPGRSEDEVACMASGIDAVLGHPTPPGGDGTAWHVDLEAYRACRGTWAFAIAVQADLDEISGLREAVAQAAWLRQHAEKCAREFRTLKAHAKPD